MKIQYHGYFINECKDGTYDITDFTGELVDGEFKRLIDAKLYIFNMRYK